MPQPQRRHEQQLQPQLPEQPHEPVDVPPTEPEELPLLQVHEHVQRFEELESLLPPTEPELEFRQQGLQQELATKLGNTMPP